MLGGLFLVTKKCGLRKLPFFLLIFIIYKFKLWNAPIPQMIIIVKIHQSPSGMENLNSRHRNRAYGAYDLNSSSNLPQMST